LNSEVERRIHRLFNSFLNLYGDDYGKFADILLRAYEGNTSGLQPVGRLLVEELADLIALLRALSIDTLGELERFVEAHRSEYGIYVLDCLGLPELYALWHRARKASFVPVIRVFINRETRTEAFKRVFSSETMSGVAEKVSGTVFRKLDEQVHSADFLGEPRNREEFLSLLVGRMRYAVSHFSFANVNVMILSDHGYDVVRVGSKYVARHTHLDRSRAALAKLAPVLMLKKPH